MANPLYQKHIISISDLSRPELELVVETAARLKAEPRHDLLRNRLVASCFFEASTRTRLSFETAVQRLGGNVIGFADAGNTSLAKKGETLADSVRIITSYTDAFVMRHPKEGAARLAAEFSRVPVINAGDGSNQHPTQTLLDLFTLYETQGRLDGLNVAFVGDLKYGRTVHSLAQALSLFGARLYLVSPEALAMPDYLCEELTERGVEFSVHETIEEIKFFDFVSIIERFEASQIELGKAISPTKKAQSIAMLWRVLRNGGKVDSAMIEEAVNLAAN